MANELLALFTGIGLSEQKAKETLKNQNVSENLTQVINEVCMLEPCYLCTDFMLTFLTICAPC